MFCSRKINFETCMVDALFIEKDQRVIRILYRAHLKAHLLSLRATDARIAAIFSLNFDKAVRLSLDFEVYSCGKFSSRLQRITVANWSNTCFLSARLASRSVRPLDSIGILVCVVVWDGMNRSYELMV